MAYSVTFDTAAVSNGVSGNASPVSVTPDTAVSMQVVAFHAAVNDNVAAAGRHLLQRFTRATGTATSRTPEKLTTRTAAALETGNVNYTADPTLGGNPLVIMTSRNVATSSRFHFRRWVPPNPRYCPTAEPNDKGWIWTMSTGNNTIPVTGGIAFTESDSLTPPALPIRGRRGRNAGYFDTSSFATTLPALITAPLAGQFVVPGINFLQSADWPTEQAQDAQTFLNLLTAAAGGTLFTQECDETITLSDVLLKQPTKLLSETLTLTDVLNKRISRTLSESITLTDSLAKLPSRTFAETITISDTLTKSALKALAETILLSDTGSSFNKIKVLVLSETLTLSDSLSKQPTILLAETLTVNATLTKQLSRVLSEAFSLVDSFTLVLLTPHGSSTGSHITRIFRLSRNQGLSNKL